MIDTVESATGPLPSDIQPVANETRDRIITGLVTLIPFLALGLAGWQVWGSALHWSDVFLFLGMYFLTGLGITVGFHRHLTHRTFKTRTRGCTACSAILGSAAIEGPVISWVADHRKHHAFSDEEGDPHSPHVDHGHGWSGAMRGLFHAHMGWLFIHTQRGNKERFAPDLLKDPMISWVDRTFLYWAILGLLLPFALGWIIGGTLFAGLTGLLWGGLVRVFVLHHFTYSINSLCHVFGKPRLRDRRRVAQPGADRDPDPRRGLAQQPPRLPDLRHPRPRPLADRHLGPGHRRAREGRPGLGRRPRSRAPPSALAIARRTACCTQDLGRWSGRFGGLVPVDPGVAGRAQRHDPVRLGRDRDQLADVGLAVVAAEALQRARVVGRRS